MGKWTPKFPHRRWKEGSHYVICDETGFKVTANETAYVTDKFSLQSKSMVIKRFVDTINPTAFFRKEGGFQPTDARLLRPEAPVTIGYISDADQIEDGDTSSPAGDISTAPQFLHTFEVSDTTITLRWCGALNPGSSPPSGFVIERELGIGGGFSTITTTTNGAASNYKDTALTTATTYNYRISAVNRDGTSVPSNEAAGTTD